MTRRTAIHATRRHAQRDLRNSQDSRLLRDNAPPRQWDALTRIGQVLRTARTLDELLARALDILLECTHTAAARVWLFSSPETLEFRFHRGLFPDAFAEPQTIPLADHPLARSARTRATVHFDTLDELPGLDAHGFVELVSVPLIVREQLVGILEIAARHRGELEAAEQIQLLEAAAPLLAMAVDHARVTAQAAQRQAELKRLWEAGLAVAAAPDYAQTLRVVVDRARELIGAEASALCLWDERKQYWVLQGTSGTTDAFQVSTKPFPTRSGNVECPVVRFNFRRAHLDVPLTHDGQVLGCLCIANLEAREYSRAERELMSGIADQAALAIENARRIESAGLHAVNTERERLAREMHDTLAQLLGFVNFKAQAAREYLAQEDVSRANQQLEQLISIAQALYADTRELILSLRAVTAPQRDLITALTEYCQHFAVFCELPVTCELSALADEHFSPMVELQLLRITQEALSNIRKHAHATRAEVRGRRDADLDVIMIQDNGQGFNPAEPGESSLPRFGLQSMHERVTSIGGTLRVESAPEQGTRITIAIPRVVHGGVETRV